MELVITQTHKKKHIIMLHTMKFKNKHLQLFIILPNISMTIFIWTFKHIAIYLF